MAGNNSNYPYWTRGWTAQHLVYGNDWQDSLGSSSSPPAIALPADVVTVTVTADYLDLMGCYFDALVTFTVATQTNDGDASTVLLPTQFKTWLVNGHLEVNLPVGFTYDVVEGMPGGRKYQVAIPSTETGTVSLVSLIDPLD